MLLAALMLLAPASADPFAAKLVEGHEWKYDVGVTRDGTRETWAFESVKPVSEGREGKTFLHFSVRKESFADASAASRAFDARVAEADPNMGLSYAWDVVFLDGDALWHLAAPCLYSRANVDRLAANLRGTLSGASADREISCACGLGCDVTGGPAVFVAPFDERGVDGAAYARGVARTVDALHWEPVSDESKAQWVLRAKVTHAGLKTVLRLQLVRRSDGTVVAEKTAGASKHVMHEVAPQLAADLLRSAP